MGKNRFYLTKNEIIRLRKKLYYERSGGFTIFKNFISQSSVKFLRSFWLDQSIDYLFSDFIKNQDVFRGCPNYLIKRPKESDRSYCCFLWNTAPDTFTQELAYKIQILRNQIEGFPIYFGLVKNTSTALQYRVSNHTTNEIVVFPHADFVEMDRKDPGADHKLDASRLQSTLILSTSDKHYGGDGLILSDNSNEKISVGKKKIAKAGDLIIWRYTNEHSVENISCSNDQSGFMRIIYPSYDSDLIDKEMRFEDVGLLGETIIRKVFSTNETS